MTGVRAGEAIAVPAYDVLTLPAFPDPAVLHGANPGRYPFLLESVAHDAPRARHDILFAFPDAALVLHADGRVYRDGQALGEGDFLAALDTDWRRERSDAAHEQDEPPFTGGWFVYLAYELAGQIEPVLEDITTDAAFPIAQATRIPAAIIRDHQTRRTHLVCERETSDRLLPALRQDVETAADPGVGRIQVGLVSEDDPARFVDGVRRVQEYIRAGDVFQVNLSRRWQAMVSGSSRSVDLYRRLRDTNPAPFAGLMSLPGNRAVLSSSPERLVAARHGTVSTRPIAGTHPRSAEPGQDALLSRELLRHPKERAEHVMLIDLERNDLGRVCRTGSVRVAELMALESYRHVHHIVSEIRGELREGVTPAQVIRAVFPGGTITGCPKVRCMQIIAELERAPRGAYTGSMGYINRDGSMDLNILIRTLVRDGDTISLRAGAGIVADSVPERELAETRAKARGMLAALETA